MQFSDEQINAIAESVREDENYGQLCDASDLQEFARRCIAAALRAQADARPVCKRIANGTAADWWWHRDDVPVGTELFTHPEASAPGLSDEQILSALEKGGVKLQSVWNYRLNADVVCTRGSIDSHKLVAGVRAVLALTRASAATVALHVEGEHFVYGTPEATALAQAKFYKADAATVAEPSDNLKDSRAAIYEASQKLKGLAGDLPDAWLHGEFVGIAEQIANLCQIPTAQQQAEPSDASKLHVGESSFEGWYQDYAARLTGNPKQTARDAYAAGMCDPLVVPCDAVRHAGTPHKFEISEEWLSKRLAIADDADCAAGQPKQKRPCDSPPGCNGNNCLGCGEQQAEPGADERAALTYWLACWDAAETEGLHEALHDAKNVRSAAAERLADLVERRIAHGVEPARAALAAQSGQRAGVPIEAVAKAYGYLWHVNEMNADFARIYPPAKAAYAARKVLREFLTHEQRGAAINEVGREIGHYVDEAERTAAPTQQQPKQD